MGITGILKKYPLLSGPKARLNGEVCWASALELEEYKEYITRSVPAIYPFEILLKYAYMTRHSFLKVMRAGAVPLTAGYNKLHAKITNILPDKPVGNAGKPDARTFKSCGDREFAPDKRRDRLKIIKDEEGSRQYNEPTGRYTLAGWECFNKDDPLVNFGLMVRRSC